MKVRASISCLMLLLVVFLSSCGTPQTAWTEERVRAVTFETLRKHNLDPDYFEPPKIKRTDTGWFVTLWPKSRIPDTDAWLTIDEQTGKISLAQGFTVFQ